MKAFFERRRKRCSVPNISKVENNICREKLLGLPSVTSSQSFLCECLGLLFHLEKYWLNENSSYESVRLNHGRMAPKLGAKCLSKG